MFSEIHCMEKWCRRLLAIKRHIVRHRQTVRIDPIWVGRARSRGYQQPIHAKWIYTRAKQLPFHYHFNDDWIYWTTCARLVWEWVSVAKRGCSRARPLPSGHVVCRRRCGWPPIAHHSQRSARAFRTRSGCGACLECHRFGKQIGWLSDFLQVSPLNEHGKLVRERGERRQRGRRYWNVSNPLEKHASRPNNR